jgi:hydroxymethylpyrimidine/phosphomethylpyrimidine kinase
MKRPRQPVALTIAGSDSGGGAGIQADLKTFASLGVHGTCAITCLTAQNPRGVLGVQAAKPEMVAQQIEAVFAALPPAAIKTGMLFDTALIRAVADGLKGRSKVPLVVDPVMVATSGAKLLRPKAIRCLLDTLLPRACLVTPNLPEAEVILGRRLQGLDERRTAARDLYRQFGCAALVKGGHARDDQEAIDFYYDGKNELLLRAPFIAGVNTHGTGCTYSAAIVGYLALGCDLSYAVQLAKEYITQAIAQSVAVAQFTALNSFWETPSD